MTVSTQQLASLSADAYKTYAAEEREKGVTLDGINYRILDQVDGRAGYQGTIYQRKDNGEIIVAHRGTEFDRELVKDGVITDAGMVVAGVNAQSRDAIALTERAIKLASDLNIEACEAPSITVTGHSLGGTLAQITAHRLGLKAETFDAYGAAGLTADYPRTDPDIVNHRRATDFVSAGSRHIGEVRTYAVDEDIRALSRNGYGNDERFPDLRNPLGVALGVGIRAHYSDNFLSNGPHGGSIINEANRARATANAEMFDDYRVDIARIHGGLALPRNVVDGIGDLGGRVLGRERPDPAPPSAFVPGTCAVPTSPLTASSPTAQVTPVPVDPTHAQHPDHALYQQAQRGVHALDAIVGRTPDAASDRLVASVVRGAKEGGLTRIDQVVLSIETPDARAGQTVFAVQGAPGDPAYRRIALDTRTALDTSVDDSFQRIDALNAANARTPTTPTPEPARVQSGPVMH